MNGKTGMDVHLMPHRPIENPIQNLHLEGVSGFIPDLQNMEAAKMSFK